MVCIILDSPKRDDDADSDADATASKQSTDDEQDLSVQRLAGGSVVKYPPVFAQLSAE